MDYIGGYVIFNDITARDIQRREMRSGVFSFCKAIDTFCPLGPWIVTPDEIPDPHDLAMELRVNGESRQVSHSGNMSVTIPEILSHYSALGYSAGDVALDRDGVRRRRLLARTRPRSTCSPGDVIEAEIERIGVLRNPVVSLAGGARRARAGARALVSARLPRRAPASLLDRLQTRTQRAARPSVRRSELAARRSAYASSTAPRPSAGRHRGLPPRSARARSDERIVAMSWPRDDAKLERVRALMAEQELDALVVRAPDNVLYLTNFWGMKGYDAVVFPREGEPVLICLEASEADAERMAWTRDVRLFRGYDEADPRPPGAARARPGAAVASRATTRIGLELSLGTQAADRMVGEPTTFPKAWFDAFPERGRRDAAARDGARDQDRAGGRADAARERDRGRARWSTRPRTSARG